MEKETTFVHLAFSPERIKAYERIRIHSTVYQ
jgi:hypothetical protein